MIAARQTFLGRCGAKLPTAADYVQDGLIAMWDGIENAGLGVHDQNATVWKDLTGNGHDLALQSYTYWTDTACAKDSRSSGRLAYRNENLTNVLSIECVFDMRSEVDNGQGRCFVQVQNSRSVMGWGLVGIRSRGAPSVMMDTTSNVLISQFAASIVYAPSESNDAIYFNGSRASTVASSGNWNLGSTLSVGGTGSSSTTIVGKCHSVRLYSRAITADEIAANYAIDKARFNLP